IMAFVGSIGDKVLRAENYDRSGGVFRRMAMYRDWLLGFGPGLGAIASLLGGVTGLWSPISGWIGGLLYGACGFALDDGEETTRPQLKGSWSEIIAGAAMGALYGTTVALCYARLAGESLGRAGLTWIVVGAYVGSLVGAYVGLPRWEGLS